MQITLREIWHSKSQEQRIRLKPVHAEVTKTTLIPETSPTTGGARSRSPSNPQAFRRRPPFAAAGLLSSIRIALQSEASEPSRLRCPGTSPARRRKPRPSTPLAQRTAPTSAGPKQRRRGRGTGAEPSPSAARAAGPRGCRRRTSAWICGARRLPAGGSPQLAMGKLSKKDS